MGMKFMLTGYFSSSERAYSRKLLPDKLKRKENKKELIHAKRSRPFLLFPKCSSVSIPSNHLSKP